MTRKCLSCDATMAPGDPVCLSCGTDERVAKARRDAAYAPRTWTAVLGPPPRPLRALSIDRLAPHPGVKLFAGVTFGGIGLVFGGAMTVIGIDNHSTDVWQFGLAVLVLLGGGGCTVLAMGLRERLRMYLLWRRGEAVLAEVTSAASDNSANFDRWYPLRVTYRYKVFGATCDGTGSLWGRNIPELPVGTQIHVLVSPNDATQSLWIPPGVS